MAEPPRSDLMIDADLGERLEKLAAAQDRPADGLVREAVETYLDRAERRERFRQDTFATWAEYQATGLHVTGAEADAWLARLEAGEQVEPPKPHK